MSSMISTVQRLKTNCFFMGIWAGVDVVVCMGRLYMLAPGLVQVFNDYTRIIGTVHFVHFVVIFRGNQLNELLCS